MVDGAIADGGNLGFILARLLKRFRVFYKRPDILVTVPMELSEIEMRAFYKVLTGLKVRRIALVEKGVADAVGIGMPVPCPDGKYGGQHRSFHNRDFCDLRWKSDHRKTVSVWRKCDGSGRHHDGTPRA